LIFFLTPVLEGNSQPRQAIAQIIIRASPLGYVHIFFAGVVLSRMFILTAMKDAETDGPVSAETQRLKLNAGEAPCLLRFGCCLGYLVYALLVVCDPKDHGYLAFHNGGLIPLMGLILVGAAVGVDPIADWIFKSSPFIMVGRVSYIQYLFQRSVWTMMKLQFNADWFPWVFPFVLVAFAWAFQRWLEAPLTDWQRLRLESDTKGGLEQIIDWLDGIGSWRRAVVLGLIICMTFTPSILVIALPSWCNAVGQFAGFDVSTC